MYRFFQILIMLSFFSCKKEPPIVDKMPPLEDEIIVPCDQEFGWGKGLKNEEEWETSTASLFHEEDRRLIGLFFETCSSEGFLRGSLGLNEISISQLGKRPVKNGYKDLGDGFIGSFYAISASHGDVQSAFYETLNSDDEERNFVNITLIDTTSKTVEGTLSVEVLIRRPDERFSDTISFKDLEFSCQIIN